MLISIQKIYKEYYNSSFFLKNRIKLLKRIPAGKLISVLYTRCAINPDAHQFVKKNVLAKYKVDYISMFRGVLLKKKTKSFRILGNYKGYFFFKHFVIDSPSLITLGVGSKSLTRLPRSNLVKLFNKSGHRVTKKFKKIK